MSGHCKDCAYLGKVTFARSGRKDDPHDDHFYQCRWREKADLPWADRARLQDISFPMIGKTHVEGDWNTEMNCPTFKEKETKHDHV